MANLSANPVWSKIGNASTEIMGPSYSYADNIPGPGSLGVGGNGSFSQLYTNINSAIQYVKILITGDPPLGNQYYVNTGGTCTASDGSTQSRMNYINNKSVGADLVPQSMSELSFLTSDLNGLVPGIAGDIEGLNPEYLFSAMTADATPSCDCYSCQVTTGSPYGFLTTELSPDFDANLCQKVDISNCKTIEGFQNRSISGIPTLFAVGLLVLLSFK